MHWPCEHQGDKGEEDRQENEAFGGSQTNAKHFICLLQTGKAHCPGPDYPHQAQTEADRQGQGAEGQGMADGRGRRKC